MIFTAFVFLDIDIEYRGPLTLDSLSDDPDIVFFIELDRDRDISEPPFEKDLERLQDLHAEHDYDYRRYDAFVKSGSRRDAQNGCCKQPDRRSKP